MRIPVYPEVIYSLARKLACHPASREFGVVTIADAKLVVCHAFGYKTHAGMRKSLEHAGKPAEPDAALNGGRRNARRKSYIKKLKKHGLTTEQAQDVLSSIGTRDWWNFEAAGNRTREKRQTSDQPSVVESDQNPDVIVEEILPGRNKIRLENARIAKSLARQLNGFAKQCELEIVGRNSLVARMFGHSSFEDLINDLEQGPPSIPDWEAPFWELGTRIDEYTRILCACGFSREQAWTAVRQIGLDGWWGFGALEQAMSSNEPDEVEEDSRVAPPRRRRAQLA